MVDEVSFGAADSASGGTSDVAPKSAPTAKPATVEVDPARKALVAEWCERVKSAKKHPKIEKAFERMTKCMRIASDGTDDAEWVTDDRYTVPVSNRLVNQAVASLYARNPKAIAKRKQKLMYTLWDGDPASIQSAMMAVQQAAQASAVQAGAHAAAGIGHNGGPPLDQTGMPMAPLPPPPPIAPDPNAVALLQEIQQVKQQLIMYDRLAKTLQLLFAYFLDEQDSGYREQIKAMVRRAKVNGVAYVKLGFQRQFGRNPDIDAQIADATNQLKAIETLATLIQTDDVDQDDAKREELRLLLADLQSKVEILVREGPVLSFPRSKQVIVDPRCHHLKTFAGSRWIAHEFDKTSDEILADFKVAVSESAREYKDTTADADSKLPGTYKVWEIWDKQNGQVSTVCDGYPDFLKEPAEPDVKIERFWTIIPLTFNEVESEKHLFPPSDVWNTRHMQREYNSSRQGLREHRVSARPRYVAAAGRLEENDKKNMSTSAAHSITELQGMTPSDKIDDILQRVPTVGVDPNLYDVDSVFSDIQRTVGAQEANLGGTSGDTATETSIAENSRMTSNADNVDDLDTVLTALARAMGQLMLLELDKQTVIEICGPGAVWPDMPPSREQVVKDLILDVEAGSSGRPNKAAELANFERAMPYLTQLPGINPIPLAKKGLDLLDIDLEEAIVEGQPSIVSMNQAMKPMMGGAPPAPGQTDPNAQGGHGGNNAPQPAGNEPQSQPAYPPPASGLQPAAGI